MQKRQNARRKPTGMATEPPKPTKTETDRRSPKRPRPTQRSRRSKQVHEAAISPERAQADPRPTSGATALFQSTVVKPPMVAFGQSVDNSRSLYPDGLATTR